MKGFFRDNGGLLLIAAVLLAAILALTGYILNFNPVTGVAEVFATPFRAVSSAVTGWVEGWYDRAFRYTELEEENRTLRERVAELEADAREGQDAVRENERLYDLLELSKERPELTFEAASVTRRSTSNWSCNLTINKGTANGVAVDNCVIDQYGSLIGVVTEVGPNWALVTTVIDPDLELGGRIIRTDDDAILEGDFTLMLEGRMKLSYLPEGAQLASGDQIATSGLGGVYPAGLMVGTIQGIFTGEDGLSRYAEVEPAADVEQVKYVYVILDFS